MDIYNFMNQKYRENKRTGHSTIKFPTMIESKKLTKDSNENKFYSCNHQSKPVVMNTTPETLSIYTEWLYNNPNNVCLECWINNKNK